MVIPRSPGENLAAIPRVIEKHEIVALGDNLSQRLLDDRYSPSKLFRISVGRAWTKLLTAGEILSLKNFMRQRTGRATAQDREHGLPAGQILWREAPPRVAEILPGGNATVEDAPCNSTDVPPNPSPATTSKAHVRRHGTGRGPRCWPAAGDLTMFGSHSGIVRRLCTAWPRADLPATHARTWNTLPLSTLPADHRPASCRLRFPCPERHSSNAQPLRRGVLTSP